MHLLCADVLYVLVATQHTKSGSGLLPVNSVLAENEKAKNSVLALHKPNQLPASMNELNLTNSTKPYAAIA